MIYRILSPGKLGYTCEAASFQEAMKTKIDLIAADVGSIDPGPYYLGAGKSYAEKAILKRDFSLMLDGALRQQCPLLLGSCGLSGDTAHMAIMVDMVKEVFEEKGIKNITVAVISGHVDNQLVLDHLEQLTPLGRMPAVTPEMVQQSAIVSQMGIAPFIKALEMGAQVVLAGRACDVAIFAADPVRLGLDAGLAYHTGHILECGAIACDPGSASDGLIAEFRDDQSVVFTAPNPLRKATVYSIAAHSLYEEDHPALQYYPEGVSTYEHTQYFQVDERTAGIKNSLFVQRPLDTKLEGSILLGERYVSLLFLNSLQGVPEKYPVYGRNGVMVRPVTSQEQEIGLLIKAKSPQEESARALLTVIKGYFMHYGFPGRKATAGNLAFPISPSEINYHEAGGDFVSFIIAGTRDPYFQSSFAAIQEGVLKLARQNFPQLLEVCHLEITVTGRETPVLYMETVAKTKEAAQARHQEDLASLSAFLDPGRPSMAGLYAGEAYTWSIYHLCHDAELIKHQLFPITLYRCDGRNWEILEQTEAVSAYGGVGLSRYDGSLDESKVDIITPVPQTGTPKGSRPLKDMARVIRSKNAKVNKMTYDIFFNSEEDYQLALRSNAFTKEAVAQTLGVPVADLIGCYRADNCQAIKISTYRRLISGSPGERDVFGAQQHLPLILMNVPIFGVNY
ncbi:MAG: DUF4387 family protein [Deltaproteobacteria bacterium]|nr:DUF4387 family protein [Deltaproteobacteria bacterium]